MAQLDGYQVRKQQCNCNVRGTFGDFLLGLFVVYHCLCMLTERRDSLSDFVLVIQILLVMRGLSRKLGGALLSSSLRKTLNLLLCAVMVKLK